MQAYIDASTALRYAQHDTETRASYPSPCHTERSEVSQTQNAMQNIPY